MCDACGRVFQTKSDRAPRFAPQVCPCGEPLMPPPCAAIGDDPLGMTVPGTVVLTDPDGLSQSSAVDDHRWTARPICYLCFRQVDKRCGGQIPNYVEQRKKLAGN